MSSCRSSLRPILQCLRTRQHHQALRYVSTTSSSPPPPPTAPVTRLRRSRRWILYTALGLSLGSSLALLMTHHLVPAKLPTPGSAADSIFLADLERRLDGEFKVKVLRGKCVAPSKTVRGEDAAWRELDPSPSRSLHRTSQAVQDRIQARQDGAQAGRGDAQSGGGELVGDAMAGARGLGPSRTFYNSETHELVSIVWLGGALTGWPGVVHGGSIATVLNEKSALAAALMSRGSTASRADESEKTEDELRGRLPEPTRLELTYKKPTYAADFYVVRATPRIEVTEGLGTTIKILGGEVQVDARLETLKGVSCVETKAVVPLFDEDALQKPGSRPVGQAVGVSGLWNSLGWK